VAKTVIDASALLALLNSEDGADIVEDALSSAAISSVNYSEVVAKLADAGVPVDSIPQVLRPLDLIIVPFDEELAFQTGLMRPAARNIGLSLGDRACLSLAKSMGLPALTADKSWNKLDLGVKIKTIR